MQYSDYSEPLSEKTNNSTYNFDVKCQFLLNVRKAKNTKNKVNMCVFQIIQNKNYVVFCTLAMLGFLGKLRGDSSPIVNLKLP